MCSCDWLYLFFYICSFIFFSTCQLAWDFKVISTRKSLIQQYAFGWMMQSSLWCNSQGKIKRALKAVTRLNIFFLICVRSQTRRSLWDRECRILEYQRSLTKLIQNHYANHFSHIWNLISFRKNIILEPNKITNHKMKSK